MGAWFQLTDISHPPFGLLFSSVYPPLPLPACLLPPQAPPQIFRFTFLGFLVFLVNFGVFTFYQCTVK